MGDFEAAAYDVDWYLRWQFPQTVYEDQICGFSVAILGVRDCLGLSVAWASGSASSGCGSAVLMDFRRGFGFWRGVVAGGGVILVCGLGWWPVG